MFLSAINFLEPCSGGNSIASAVLPLAFIFGYQFIDKLIRKEHSKSLFGPRYLCGICSDNNKKSESVGHSFNK